MRIGGPFQYGATIQHFLQETNAAELIAFADEFATEITSRLSWAAQVQILQEQLEGLTGQIYFEFKVPRLGLRIDTVLVIADILYVIEFKITETLNRRAALTQVWDYALDLRNFHEASHQATIIPIVAAPGVLSQIAFHSKHSDQLYDPLIIDINDIRTVIDRSPPARSTLPSNWSNSRYCPTPNIVEAAKSLYRRQSVDDIARHDASAKNLSLTTAAIDQVIHKARSEGYKAICFVTGVPGAGKTLVGLNVATKHSEPSIDKALHAIYLSGNGPLVNVLTEALARDHRQQKQSEGKQITLSAARSEVRAFIQNVHHYRDACLTDPGPPIDRVALFDEAQRAWTRDQLAKFMLQKKNRPGFDESEPEFLISCLDRHEGWATVICLVGGGQEINQGEAGISEWATAIHMRFRDWRVYVSSRLLDQAHDPTGAVSGLLKDLNVSEMPELHLSVSMRSFRSERVSHFVQALLQLELEEASETFRGLQDRFPIVLTRDVNRARDWMHQMRRGSDRSGLVASSKGERLKAKGIHVKATIDPVHWFLEGDEDVRSSNFHEDVATEFDVQGLELDWVGVLWDADFRHNGTRWENHEFKGNRWQLIRRKERQNYQKNAYRVLLTRARQGMVIVVPEGNSADPTRLPKFYDGTFCWLQSLGINVI